MRRLLLALFNAALLVLAGCDQLGIESAATVAARNEAEGKAIGAGCRHAARSLEECYANNRRADKAAVFAGWKDMSDYMRENKIEPVRPADEPVVAAAEDTEPPAKADAAAEDKPEKAAKAGKGEARDKSDKGDKGEKGEKGDKATAAPSPKRATAKL
jgi:hypothetical protein